jgi:hypothetical protein
MHHDARMKPPRWDLVANCISAWAARTPLRSVVCSLAIASSACNAPPDPEDEQVPAGEAPSRWSMGVEIDDDLTGDLRPEAIALIEARHEGVDQTTDVPETIAAAWQPPTTIRVWRRGLDGSSASCSGRVDTIPFEKYVKGVLPHEWIRSWHGESLRAGAIAIRTYAANWVRAGGKYTCADLDDTTASQVYKDEFFAVTNTAVDATANTFVMKNGLPVFAEYSAENGHPTATGISDSLCAGKARFGHGRGTCQWGSQRWASQSGKSHTWILEHYYPGATVVKVGGGGGGGGGGGTAIIVDSENANNDATKAKVEYAGTWTASTGTPGYHATSYRWAATEQSSSPATFSFFMPAAGTRTIDAWWVAGTNRSAAASFIVYNASGAEVGRVAKNQQTAGSTWNTLGTYAFTAGWNRVVLSRWQAPGSVVVADAIRVR